MLDLQSADDTAAAVEALGQKALAFNADVTNEADVKSIVERIDVEWGGIDILVNNVGSDHALLLEDTPTESWDFVMDVNLKGLFLCTKFAAESMKRRGGGKIVNISSLAGLRMTIYGGIAYSASKAGVNGFTRHCAFELGPSKINVNAVCPGPTMTEALLELAPEEAKQKTLQSTPLQDFTYPEDQADAVVFLASDRARMITGTTLLVDGGISLPVGYVEYDKFYAERKEWLEDEKWDQSALVSGDDSK